MKLVPKKFKIVPKNSIGVLVSMSACDMIVIDAAVAQAIPKVIEHKREIKENIKTCFE